MAYPVTINGKTYDLDFTFNIGARSYADPVGGLRPFLLDFYTDLVLRGVTFSTSTTSVSIGTGNKTVTLADSAVFVPGQYVVISSTANSGNFMEGRVTGYNAGTKALTINSAFTGGSGTFASWNVAVSGQRGPTGATGGITGPGASTTNALAKWSNTTGSAVTGTGVTVDASDNLTSPGIITGGNIATSGNGNITAGGTGTISGTTVTATDVVGGKVARLPLVALDGLPTGGAAATAPTGNVHLFADANGLGLLYNGGVVKRMVAGTNVTMDSNGIHVQTASTGQAGVMRFATAAEALDQTRNDVALTPQTGRQIAGRRAIPNAPVLGNLNNASVTISTDNRVLLAGNNDNRIMGAGDNSTHNIGYTPIMGFPRTSKIVKVCLDYNAIFVLYANGEVWALGINTNNKVGSFSWNAVIPNKLPYPEPIVDIITYYANGGYWGDRSGVSAKGASGAFYAHGSNPNSELFGNGVTTNPIINPTQVPYTYEKVWGIPGNGGIMFGRDANKVLWVWGYSYAGRAGNGSSDASPALTTRVTVLNVPQNATEYVDEVEVKTSDNVAGGIQFDSQILFRTNLGNLYVTGQNDSWQAGLPNTGPGRSASWIYQPQLLATGVAKAGIINPRYGGWILGTDGILHLYGYLMASGAINQSANPSTSGPAKAMLGGADPNFFDGKVAKVVVNKTSYDTPWMAVLTTDGKVYATGYNGNGNLGFGTTAWQSTFAQVPGSVNGDIVDMWCNSEGPNGSLAMLNRDGEILATGPNNNMGGGYPRMDASSSFAHTFALIN